MNLLLRIFCNVNMSFRDIHNRLYLNVECYMLPLAYQVETIRLGEKTVEIPKKIQVTSMMRWGTTLGYFIIRFVFKIFKVSLQKKNINMLQNNPLYFQNYAQKIISDRKRCHQVLQVHICRTNDGI